MVIDNSASKRTTAIKFIPLESSGNDLFDGSRLRGCVGGTCASLVARFTAENNMLSVGLKNTMANCLLNFNLSRLSLNKYYNGAGSPHTPGRDPTGGSAPGGTRCPSKTRPTGQAPSTGPRGEKSSNTLYYYWK